MPRLRALYICYLSLEDPLLHSQVVAYLIGLAAGGHRIHLLTFETGPLSRARRKKLRAGLGAHGIAWHGLRYHKQPSLPATIYDTLAGALYAASLITRHRLNAVHARNHVPAAMALIARRLLWRRRVALIFDIRGLMADEYADAGLWRPGGIAFRLTKAVERAALRRADAVIVLTERLRRQLSGGHAHDGTYTIPCCADLSALAAAGARREDARRELGLEEATVMVYVGKFGARYMAAEMADFFVLAKRRIPDLHFLVLTQSDRKLIRRQLERRGAGEGYTIASTSSDQIGFYLAAADFGIAFIRPTPSEISASPTKVGEYHGAGLPVVCTAGIGDLDKLIVPEIGTRVDEHTAVSYRSALEHMIGLLATEDTRERCRTVARRELSLDAVGIPRYRRCYERVARRL